MSIEFEYDGRRYRFDGEYLDHELMAYGDHFLALDGTVQQFERGRQIRREPRAIVHPVPRRYHAYGVVWEESGAVRSVKEGEVFLMDGHVCFRPAPAGHTACPYPILRPVALLEAEA